MRPCEENPRYTFLTIKSSFRSHIKRQNDNKIRVSCSANQQNVTLHVKHDHQYSRSFKSLNNLGSLLVFSAFIETLEFSFQEKRPPFSMLNAKRFEIV